MSQGQTGLPLCKIRRKPGFVPGTSPVCPGDKPGLSRGHSRGVPRATGPKSLCLCAFFLPDQNPFPGKRQKIPGDSGFTIKNNIGMAEKGPIQGIPGNPFSGSRTGILEWFSLADETNQSWYVGHGGCTTVVFELITFLIQKHFKTVTVTVIFG